MHTLEDYATTAGHERNDGPWSLLQASPLLHFCTVDVTQVAEQLCPANLSRRIIRGGVDWHQNELGGYFKAMSSIEDRHQRVLITAYLSQNLFRKRAKLCACCLFKDDNRQQNSHETIRDSRSPQRVESSRKIVRRPPFLASRGLISAVCPPRFPLKTGQMPLQKPIN